MPGCTPAVSGARFVASTTATRLWKVCKEAGRPFPVLDDDPVIDFQITEAVAIKVISDEDKARKQAEKRQWRRDKGGLDKLREAAGVS